MKVAPPRAKQCDDDGGAAYPAELSSSGPQSGMSLRDYFAAQAVAGLCANSTNSEVRGLGHFPTFAAEWAYRMADAMLDARVAGRKA